MSKLLTKQLASAQRELRKQMNQLRIRQGLLRRSQIKQVWNMFPASVRKSVSVSVSDFSDCVRFSLVLDGLTSLKDDPRLMSVLEKFAGDEWRAFTSDWTGGETPNRDFTFHSDVPADNGLPHFRIQVTVMAYVKSDSPTCKIETRVLTETVTKEERIIVCA